MMTAVVLFAIAAVGGVTLAAQRFMGRPQPSLPLALGHGALAASGLIAMIVAVMGGTAPAQARTALVIFLVAALGGFTLLFGFHLRKKALPLPVVVIHGAVAVIAFVILLAAVLGPEA